MDFIVYFYCPHSGNCADYLPVVEGTKDSVSRFLTFINPRSYAMVDQNSHLGILKGETLPGYIAFSIIARFFNTRANELTPIYPCIFIFARFSDVK